MEKVNNSRLTFTCITFGQNGMSSSFFSMTAFDKKTSRHRILLEAIRSYLSNIEPLKHEGTYVLVFYTGNDEIAYEWHQEYLKEGSFASSTQDISLYEEIVRLLDRINVEMEVIGKNNVLNSVGKVFR